jgi:hypothetical protein
METGYQFRRQPTMLIFRACQQQMLLRLREGVEHGLPLFQMP